jgi:NAD(P)-dependent dehydrogenase (short-subunit alcohol dehydrogenase family)
LHTAAALKKDGWQVVAGARSFANQPGEGEMGYRLALDVTSRDSVKDFCLKAEELFGAPDVLVNCAAVLTLGAVEDISDDEFKNVLTTNVIGQTSMIRQVLPLMRAKGHGRIVNFSSINGLMGIPFQSAYTASKHAVEGYSECLAMELAPYHIEVTLVEPGDHRSGSQAYRKRAQSLSPCYADAFSAAASVISHDEATGSDPDKLGWIIARALRKRRMPFRLRIGRFDQRLAVVLHDILPAQLFSWIIGSHYKKQVDEGRQKSHG